MNLELPKTLEEFFTSCETNCVADCCGLQAFDFSIAHLRQWMRGKRPEHQVAPIDQLSSVIEQIEISSEKEISCSRLNAGWLKDRALAFFDNLKSTLLTLIERPGGPGAQALVDFGDGSRSDPDLDDIFQLWAALENALFEPGTGWSVIKHLGSDPLEHPNPKVGHAWTALTAPINLTGLRKWAAQGNMNPAAREATQKAIKRCLERCK